MPKDKNKKKKKKWGVAGAALSAAKKKLNASKRGKQSSSESSYVSSESSFSSSGRDDSQSDSDDSYSDRSSNGPGVKARSGGGQKSDGSTDSSSYGCGTYHRRESLSASSSESSYGDDSSYSSSSRSRSSGSGKSYYSTESEDAQSLNVSQHGEAKDPKSRSLEASSESLSSRPSLKSLVKAMSSKKLSMRDLSVDVDDESQASSKVSRSNKSIGSNKTNTNLNPSMYDDEQASMMQRRRGGRGRGQTRPVRRGSAQDPNNEESGGRGRGQSRLGDGGSARELKNEGSHAEGGSSRPLAAVVSGKKAMSAQNANDESTNDADLSRGKREEENSEDQFDVLLERVRSQKSIGKKKPQAPSSTNHEVKNTIQAEKASTMASRDAGGELSLSLKTVLLANANSNLRSSVTSLVSEKSDSQNDDASKKSAGSSRFASMMANLKSSNEQSSGHNRDVEVESLDDEHIFEAPKIVDEKGQSMRCLTNASNISDDLGTETKSEEEDEDDGKRSRFRVRRPSLKKLIRGKSDKSLETAKKEEDDDDKQRPSDELGEYQSDDDSRRSDASISTASSDEGQDPGSVSNLARMRYPEDEDNYSDDDAEYYGEPDMTILTPITELESMESETASHFSDASESDSDDDIATNSRPVDPPRGKTKNERPSDMAQVIARVKENDPALKRIELDDNGLNDFDAARLLYSLHENTHVTHMSLANNKLGDGSAVALAQVLLVSETITFVCLRGNNIGNQGALALKKVLKVNDTLSHLDIKDNDIDSYVMEALQKSSASVVSSDPYSSSSRVDEPTESACDDRSVNHLPVGEGQDTPSGVNSDSSSACEDGANVPSTAPSSEYRNNESLNSRSLLKIYDKLCVSDDDYYPLAVQDNLRELDAKTQGENAHLLAISLSLSMIDSEWLLKATVEDGRSSLTRKTLGERERLLPLKKSKIESRYDANEKDHSFEFGTSMRKASAGPLLRKMTASKWKKTMSKASMLRNSLLTLSQLSIHEESKPKTMLSSSHQTRYWLSSLKKLDPRWQIRKFFNDMSVFGSVLNDLQDTSEGAAIFTVWRPTSADAIGKMMRGDGVGKGLEIKGKSAKRGDLSGYIPFLQIHQEEHKKEIRIIPKGDRTKIFFRSHTQRDEVGDYLGTISKELTLRVAKAKFALARAKFGCDSDAKKIMREEIKYAAKTLSYELENPKVVQNDDYAPELYCIEVSCRVLWEGLVARKDISRSPESNFDTGRASQPAFQDMNFAALRRRDPAGPLPVLFQTSEDDPFDARMLVMAYEEEGKVKPVVSDFDCFLIGSRNFSYEDPMSPEQVELLDWCVSQIEWILDNHTYPDSWTTRWLEVLKYAANNGFYPSMPQFGFGDPTSYSMIEASVHRSSKTCGAVRHGPECFNFFFPQELDENFLIVFPGSQIWKYVSESELRSILRKKIQEGFTFPLNPKWLLCDPGWINLFKDLLESNHPSVKASIDMWFPPESGLRERILDISQRFPNGFQSDDRVHKSQSIAEHEYERYLVWQRARKKLRGFFYWRSLLLDVRKHASSSIDDNCRDAVQELNFLSERRTIRLSHTAKTKNIEGETIKEIRKLDFFGRTDDLDDDESDKQSACS